MAEIKSAVIRALREELHARGFLEVETPVLQPVHGGANARPFTTHINAYDLDNYLRIALELHLKRLLVGGIEKVFEIGRIFRNEGVDATHNPEFTMLEFYEAYGDYNTVGTLTRELIQAAAMAALGTTVLRRVDGTEFDIAGEWPSKTVHGAVSEALGEEITPDTSEKQLRKLCAQVGVPAEPAWNRGQLLLEMYERLVERQTVGPTFYRDFPVEVSPLTRAHRKDPRLAERWDLVAFGTELGTGYSELTDPIEERARLTEQSLLAAGGDPEAMQLDEDFLRALEYGMPPAGGVGVGIDRILIMFTGESIRETILFPMVRPE
jgi:lysyl-tRNA synthetase class 2